MKIDINTDLLKEEFDDISHLKEEDIKEFARSEESIEFNQNLKLI